MPWATTPLGLDGAAVRPFWPAVAAPCNSANPWRWRWCAAWPPPWPCHCCRPACPSCWPPWLAPPGAGGCAARSAFRARPRHDALTAILLACAATYLTKLVKLRRARPLAAKPRMARVVGAITVALLSALTVMNTLCCRRRPGDRCAPGCVGRGCAGPVAAAAVLAGGAAGGAAAGLCGGGVTGYWAAVGRSSQPLAVREGLFHTEAPLNSTCVQHDDGHASQADHNAEPMYTTP